LSEREIFSLILNYEQELSNRIKSIIFDNYSLEAFSTESLDNIIRKIKKPQIRDIEKTSLIIQNLQKNLIVLRHCSEEKLRKIKETSINLVHAHSDDYPEKLKKLTDKPLILFLRGRLVDFSKSISIVGTRYPTQIGKEIAFNTSKLLASQGWVIVSGLAKGIDTQAHLGAIDVHGKTIAVLGTPLSKLSPKENTKIAKKIEQHGFLVTEYDEYQEIKKENFVRRNRITVSFSKLLMVIETKLTGGSISTINYANRLKIPIFIPNVEKWYKLSQNEPRSIEIYKGLNLLKEGRIITNKKEKKLTSKVVEFDFTNKKDIFQKLEQVLTKAQNQTKMTDFSR